MSKSSSESTCALCGKPARSAEFLPFCSAICRDRDLLKWLGEGYRLPGKPAEEEGDSVDGAEKPE